MSTPTPRPYDQVVVGHLLQIARDLKESSGDTDVLRRRVSTSSRRCGPRRCGA